MNTSMCKTGSSENTLLTFGEMIGEPFSQNKCFPCDENYMRHVGWNEGSDSQTQNFFSPLTVQYISRKVSELCEGLDTQNRKIVVPNDVICHIMSTVYNTRNPRVGDIYSTFTMPQEQDVSILQTMIDRTINIIYSNVKTDILRERHNCQLSIWDTVLGPFNKHGLQSHPKIKLKNKHPDHGLIFMRF